MTSQNVENFRLTVLNPGGRDPEQQFHSVPAPGEGAHPPINFHAFAACTFGAFHRDTRRAARRKHTCASPFAQRFSRVRARIN